MTNSMSKLKEKLEQDFVLVAEGYIFELERRGYIKAGPFVPEVVLEYPDAVNELHNEFVRAGSDVVVACTYYGHRSKLKAIDREDQLEALNRQSISLNCGRGPATMFPILEEIRQTVSGHVAALPVPYRTDKNQPCFFELRLPEGKNAFPVALDPFLLTRFEMAEFALAARKLGIDYIGICCGAGPHHVRAMAEALGRTAPASKYSPSIDLHPIFGDAASQKQNFRECLYGLKLEK